MGELLPGERPWWDVRRWQVAVALIAVAVLVISGVHWYAQPRTVTERLGPGGPVSAAQGFADAAAKAFSTSATVLAASVASTAEQRSADLPADPVAGLTSTTAAGPVQVVLPGGLGAAQHTSGGQVVYPDAGAGFDMLAENTGTGTRTVARIAHPAGVRMVTTFVRTPADTVMLAHTNGYLTINRATPAAETVGMFSPAETRDATGTLVPSSYVVKQVRPGLYQLSEVIDPRPDTVWPVYVDPPLHTGGPGGAPLPVGLFDSITSTVSSAASAVGDAVTTAASATVSGATAVGTFVKENPLQSAILVGGVALALTGVGGPAGAAAIAAATVNLASAGVDIAAAAMPDNQTLGMASTVLGVASMVTPQGAVKKVAEEGAEQVLKHTDDIVDGVEGVVDVAKTAPTPPTQVADDITAGAPNAPPAGNVIPGGEHSWPLPPAAADQRLTTDITSRTTLRQQTKKDIHAAAERDPDSGLPLDPNTGEPIHGTPDIGHKPGFEEKTTNDMVDQYGLSRREKNEWSNEASHYRLEAPSANRSHQYEDPRGASRMYEDEYTDWLQKNMQTNPLLAQDPTAQRRLANLQGQARPTGAAEQRQIQETSVRQSTDGQRDAARQSASDANRTGGRSSSESQDRSGGKGSDKKKSNSKQKKKKSSQHHSKPKG